MEKIALKAKGTPRELKAYLASLVEKYGEKATLKEVCEKEGVKC